MIQAYRQPSTTSIQSSIPTCNISTCMDRRRLHKFLILILVILNIWLTSPILKILKFFKHKIIFYFEFKLKFDPSTSTCDLGVSRFRLYKIIKIQNDRYCFE